MNSKLEKKLKKLNVVIAAHIFASGPALDLEEYLKKKVKTLMFIGHPFSYRKDTASFYRLRKNGKLKIKSTVFDFNLPEIPVYFKDALLTFFWIIFSKQKFNLYLGSDNFLAYLGLLLKKLGKVDEVVLYTIDFMPNRFPNPILNWLYHYFDKECLKNCKIIWNLSDKMAEGREVYMNSPRDNFKKQITVPLGIWDKRIPKLTFAKKNRYQIVFMGHLLQKQGLDIVLEAMKLILNKIPKAKLLIIGTGEYEKKLKAKVIKLKIAGNVEFSGYIENHQDVEKMLSESMISVATYKPDPESFTYFADPGKIKNYLSAGLPVILTDVPPIARVIENKNAAVIVDYNVQSFAKAAIKLLSSPKLINEYSQNAVKYIKNYDWDRIFEQALSKTID